MGKQPPEGFRAERDLRGKESGGNWGWRSKGVAAPTSLPSVSASVPWAQVLSLSLGCLCPPGLGLGQQNSPKEIQVRNENTPTPCPGGGRGRASAGAHGDAEPRAECGGVHVGPRPTGSCL